MVVWKYGDFSEKNPELCALKSVSRGTGSQKNNKQMIIS